MKLLVTLSAFLLSSFVMAMPVRNIVVFGDSLSDNGNFYNFMNQQMPESPPYFEGRFSDGPVWIERLAAAYYPNAPKAHLQDYAFGGAGVSEDDEDDVLFTLRKEVNTYLEEHSQKASADTLYVVWIGANNYLGLPEDGEKTLKDVNLGIVHGLQKLVEKGAKNFLILNLPDLGRTPAATEFNSVEMLSYFAKKHNTALDESMAELKYSYPEVNWLYYDLNQMFTNVLDHPEEYGITNTTDTCLESSLDKNDAKSMLNIAVTVKPSSPQNTCERFLFFDLVHPTAYAHQVMADKAKSFLDAAGMEFID